MKTKSCSSQNPLLLPEVHSIETNLSRVTQELKVKNLNLRQEIVSLQGKGKQTTSSTNEGGLRMKRMKLQQYVLAAMFIAIMCGTPRAHAQLYTNQAASFAGTASSYIAVPHSPSLNITGSFTVECLVKPNSLGLYELVSNGNASTFTGFDLLLDSGRVRIRTNGGTRFISTSATRSQVGIWAHVACTYNSATNIFITYINGTNVGIDTVAGAAPATGTDSLYLGKGFNSPYDGLMDDVRIWNRDLTSAEIGRNRRSALATPGSGVYGGLVFSMPFQHVAGTTAFTTFDFSGNGNTGILRGATAVDLSNRQFVYDTYNEALKVGAAQGYLAGPNNSAVNLTGSFTLEAWVYPLVASLTGDKVFFEKGIGASAPGRYLLSMRNGKPVVETSSGIRVGKTLLQAGYWSHVAATYNTASDSLVLYVNGDVDTVMVIPGYEPAGNTDSLYIGELGPSTCCGFEGFIDEVRIANYSKTRDQIRSFMYRSINDENEPNSGFSNVVYSFDNGTYEDTDGGPVLRFNGDAIFSNPSRVSNTPVSPMLRADAQNFPTGYFSKSSNRRIPATGTSGLMVNDTLRITQNVVMSDVNFFLLTNHTFDSDMDITLIAPNGDTVAVAFDASFTDADDNIIAIFDDNADSSLVPPPGTNPFTSPAPRIKPQNVMNTIFSGDNAQGSWVLRINDDAGGDTGRVYAWGIQINNQASVTGVEEVLTAVPNEYKLDQNYPNPFNPSTTIQFAVPQQGLIKLVVFDLLGREVTTLVNEVKPAGTYKATFDASKFASGAYFYRLQAGSFLETKKMIFLK